MPPGSLPPHPSWVLLSEVYKSPCAHSAKAYSHWEKRKSPGLLWLLCHPCHLWIPGERQQGDNGLFATISQGSKTFLQEALFGLAQNTTFRARCMVNSLKCFHVIFIDTGIKSKAYSKEDSLSPDNHIKHILSWIPLPTHTSWLHPRAGLAVKLVSLPKFRQPK